MPSEKGRTKSRQPTTARVLGWRSHCGQRWKPRRVVWPKRNQSQPDLWPRWCWSPFNTQTVSRPFHGCCNLFCVRATRYGDRAAVAAPFSQEVALRLTTWLKEHPAARTLHVLPRSPSSERDIVQNSFTRNENIPPRGYPRGIASYLPQKPARIVSK